MQYLGGKSRIGKNIADVINGLLRPNQSYVEPFIGSGWVLQYINKDRIRIASDIHPDLILMWKALQQGWIPPSTISEDEYNKLRHADPSPLRGFTGFGCSFGGRWFGGYARGSIDRNYASNAKNSLLKKVPRIVSVDFSCQSYLECRPHNSVVYCDPPYAGTTKYANCIDYSLFWHVMEDWAKDNTVVVSEYTCLSPAFMCVARYPTKLDIRSSKGREDRIECLFSTAALE